VVLATYPASFTALMSGCKEAIHRSAATAPPTVQHSFQKQPRDPRCMVAKMGAGDHSCRDTPKEYKNENNEIELKSAFSMLTLFMFVISREWNSSCCCEYVHKIDGWHNIRSRLRSRS